MKIKKISVLILSFALALTSALVTVPEQIHASNDTMIYKDHTYRVYTTNEAITWSDAKDACEKMGGHLVTLSSKKENDKVYALSSNFGYRYSWIGLYNEGTDSKDNANWKWVNGENVSYTCWANGQPDCYQGVEFNCHYFGTSEWNDAEDDPSIHHTISPVYSFICEWDYAVKPAKSKITLNCGGSSSMKVSFTNAPASLQKKTPTFASTDMQIAKVSSSGKIIGVNAGTCIISATVGDFTVETKVVVKPKKVTKLRKSGATRDSITLSWDSQPNVTAYEVYMYDTDFKEYTKMQTISAYNTSTTIYNLKHAKTYKFKVRAVYTDNNKDYFGPATKAYSAKTK